MSTIKITDAAVEPLSLAEAKTHLRETLVSAENDAYIESLIKTVRTECENRIERSLLATTWKRTLDSFPVAGIELLRPPMLSVEFVRYVDEAGVLQTLDPAVYEAHREEAGPTVLAPVFGASWPRTRPQRAAVQVQYVAGYHADNAALVPTPIRSWMRLALEELYRERGLTASKLTASFGVGLIEPYKVWSRR